MRIRVAKLFDIQDDWAIVRVHNETIEQKELPNLNESKMEAPRNICNQIDFNDVEPEIREATTQEEIEHEIEQKSQHEIEFESEIRQKITEVENESEIRQKITDVENESEVRQKITEVENESSVEIPFDNPSTQQSSSSEERVECSQNRCPKVQEFRYRPTNGPSIPAVKFVGMVSYKL